MKRPLSPRPWIHFASAVTWAKLVSDSRPFWPARAAKVSDQPLRGKLKSSARFREIAKQNGADVLIANHTNFDGSKTKLPAVLARRAGQPNPYVIGEDAVQRYMTVVNECAQAGLAANPR